MNPIYIYMWFFKTEIQFSESVRSLGVFLDESLSVEMQGVVRKVRADDGMSVWELSGFSTALKYALTSSIFCLVCIGGRSSVNLMVSVGVSLVFPSMTGILSFCTLASCSRVVCHCCETWSIVSDTEHHHTLRYQITTVDSMNFQNMHEFPEQGMLELPEHSWISRIDRKLLTTVYYVVSLFWCLTLISCSLVSIHACSKRFRQQMVPSKLILLLLALQGRWEIKLMSSPAVQSIISHLQIWKISEV